MLPINSSVLKTRGMGVVALLGLLVCQTGWGGSVVMWGPHLSPSVVRIGNTVLSNVVQVAVGGGQCLALLGDGTVVGWGTNDKGQATGVAGGPPGYVMLRGRRLTHIVAVSAGPEYSLALESRGTFVAWGKEFIVPPPAKSLLVPNFEDLPPSYSNLVAQTDGGRHALTYRQAMPVGMTNIVAISAGWDRGAFLAKNGNVIAWNEPRLPLNLTNVVAVSAGTGFRANGIAAQQSGMVLAWTFAGAEVQPPADVVNVSAVASAPGMWLALRQDGEVVEWLNNGQSAILYSNAVAIATGYGRFTFEYPFSLALLNDGRVAGDLNAPSTPSGLKDVTAIAAGQDICLAVTTNISAWSP